MKGFRIKKSIEVFFVILLIMGLCISAVVLMNAGRKTYGRILENNNQLENARIALSYLSMRIRQNDEAGSIVYLNNAIDGQAAVILRHTGAEEGMTTYIYHKDGSLRELYTWVGNEPDPEDSETVVDIDGLYIEYSADGNFLKITAHYLQDGETKQMTRIIGIKTD